MENNRFFNILGWVAMAVSISMYVSYIPRIGDNLTGHKGNPVQPLVAAINCSLRVMYDFFKEPKRDYPVLLANLPSTIFSLIAFATAL